MGQIHNLRIKSIQKSLQTIKLDGKNIHGWLLYDFHNRDPITYRILKLNENNFHSRRWYYYIPSNGLPQKLVSAVEPGALDDLPGNKSVYRSLSEQKDLLHQILFKGSNILMNYSPMNDVPYVSMLDAGTFELIQSFGCNIHSAQDLIQEFEGLVDEKAFETHQRASKIMHEIMESAFEEIERRISEGLQCREVDIRHFIQESYKKNNLITVGSPEVAINQNAADPHYSPSGEGPNMKEGDLVLIDSWAKFDEPGAVYYDHTWMAYIGEEIPSRIQEIWEIVCKARDTAVEFERDKIENGQPCYGWEIDHACRKVIDEAGYGDFYVHRTGHSIGQEVHGNAVHIDGLETHDTRQVVPLILHSIEPGIYLMDEKIGIRSEIDVYIDSNRRVIVTGPIQNEIVKILPRK
ncbi:M24 family metallopeptidase [Candidatus Harpocratesius sp.]